VPNWWTNYDDSDWRQIPQDELPSELDFVAVMDERTGNVVYDEPNFVDATSFVSGLRNSDEFQTTLFVGSAIYLKGADKSGAVMLDVDGSVEIHTRTGQQPGQHELKMKILFWPLKSEEREPGEVKGRFKGEANRPTTSVPDDEEVIPSEPKDDDELFPDPETLGGWAELAEDSPCAEAFQQELIRVGSLYDHDDRSEFLAGGHVAIATIMSDYGMTDEDIADEILEVADQVSPEIFYVTEDDIPKVVLIRLLSGSVNKLHQRNHLTDMTYQMDLLRKRTTVRGLSDSVARSRYSEIKKVRKLDPEFHFHLVVMDTDAEELVDTSVLEFDGVRPGTDRAAVHSIATILNLYCAEESPSESTATFTVDADKYFTFDGTTGNRLAQILVSAEEYVKGTYPIGVDLFRLNPRLFLSKAAGPNKGMKQTLETQESELFHLLNNGITGVCESLQIEKGRGNVKITATNLQIVNGCQTTETIWAWARRAADRTKVMVPLRIVQAGVDESLARRISMTTNSQSAIAAADLVANDEIQKRSKLALGSFNLFYEARRGEWGRLSIAERNRLREHGYDWTSAEILKINLRELGQALLSVSGRPNQAKEQIAGLFKEQNRSTYREVFGDSWDDASQLAFVSMLYIFLRDIDNWVSPAASKEYRTLAGLGRFYVMYLLYEFWRKGDDAFVGTEAERAEGQEFLVEGESCDDWIADFDAAEIAPLANMAIKALDWVYKNSDPAIDGYRALLRQGAHKAAIEDRFRTLLDAAGK
jgi:hypothetical protein